jgi:hypothetical protein
MADLYTKAMLTVIAVALIGLGVQNFMQHASAAYDCGFRGNPCHVDDNLLQAKGIPVWIENPEIRNLGILR